MDSITNKLRDLEADLARRDAVGFRMHLHELGQRGLYDVELDELTASTRAGGFDTERWSRLAERLAAVVRQHGDGSEAP